MRLGRGGLSPAFPDATLGLSMLARDVAQRQGGTGELGVRLLHRLLERGQLVAGEHGYRITHGWLQEIGVDPKMAGPQGERFAYPCLDWSGRRDHLAGRLATTLLDHFLARRSLVRVAQSRALKLTRSGQRSLLGLRKAFRPTARSS